MIGQILDDSNYTTRSFRTMWMEFSIQFNIPVTLITVRRTKIFVQMKRNLNNILINDRFSFIILII